MNWLRINKNWLELDFTLFVYIIQLTPYFELLSLLGILALLLLMCSWSSTFSHHHSHHPKYSSIWCKSRQSLKRTLSRHLSRHFATADYCCWMGFCRTQLHVVAGYQLPEGENEEWTRAWCTAVVYANHALLPPRGSSGPVGELCQQQHRQLDGNSCFVYSLGSNWKS